MAKDAGLPAYRFRSNHPSLLELATKGITDVASVIPKAILHERSIQLPSPPLGQRSPLVISDPELAREVLLDSDGRFGRDIFMRRLMRRSWGQGLAAADGEDWKCQRKAVSPLFRAGATADYADDFARIAREAMNAWGDDEQLDLSHLSRKVVARTVLSVLIAQGDEADPEVLAEQVPRYLARIGKFDAMDLLPLPEKTHDRLRGIAADPAVRSISQAAQAIAGREAAPARPDFASLISPVGPVADNVRGLFPAAIDTTVQALVWSLLALAEHAQWQERVAAEVRQANGTFTLEALPLTRCVVEEVLRLFPPAPMLARSAMSDQALDGQPVRKGQGIIICIYAMHRHNLLWDEPERFDPERFAAGASKYPAFMPFGHGPRVCIAARFALQEVVAMVAQICALRKLELSGPKPEVSLQITTRPASPIHIRARLR